MELNGNNNINPKETIHLFLKGCWFLMIASGEKKEEYRQIKPYWTKRLFGKPLKYVIFHNGYSGRFLIIRLNGITLGTGNPRWGAVPNEVYLILQLGELVIKHY